MFSKGYEPLLDTYLVSGEEVVREFGSMTMAAGFKGYEHSLQFPGETYEDTGFFRKLVPGVAKRLHYTVISDPLNNRVVHDWYAQDYFPVILTSYKIPDSTIYRTEHSVLTRQDIKPIRNLRLQAEKASGHSGYPILGLIRLMSTREDMKGDVRLVQETQVTPRSLKRLEMDQRTCKSESDISDSLRQFGFNTTHVRIHRRNFFPREKLLKNQEKSGLNMEDQEKLRQFSILIRKMEVED